MADPATADTRQAAAAPDLAARYRAVFEHSRRRLTLIDPGGVVLDMNAAALHHIGRRREEVVGRSLTDAGDHSASVPDPQCDQIANAVRMAASGIASVVPTVVATQSLDVAMHSELSFTPVRDAQGTVTMILLEGQDISEDVAREQALSISEARLRLAAQVAQLGVFEHDHATGVISVSRSGGDHVEALSYFSTLDQMIASLHPEDRERMRETIRHSQDPGADGRYRIDVRVQTAEHGYRWVSVVCQCLFEGEGANRRPRRTIGASHDITDRKRAEQELRDLNASLEHRVAERTRELSDALNTLRIAQDELVRNEKLAALGALVAGVAHELNTPIGNALMVASTLRDKSLAVGIDVAGGALRRSVLDEYLNMNVSASRLLMDNLGRAAELVANFKQVAVDQTSAKRRPFDLEEVIREVMSTVRFLSSRQQIRVELELAAGVAMDSYPGPLGQVINNFFNNALAHAFSGLGAGEIRIRTRPYGEHQVLLEFSDNGTGIDPAHIPRLFDPFFTTRLGQGGSGLGLNIVHTIVTAVLGGSINVASVPGRGTTFTLILPLDAPRNVEAGAD